MQLAEERQRQEAVGDGHAEGGFAAGALGIDVDPLPVAGYLGELVDRVLSDGQPVAGGDFLADERFQVVQRAESGHWGILL